MLGRAVQGLTLVVSGAVAEGMAVLDEVNAAVIAGELTDLGFHRIILLLPDCSLRTGA